MKNIYVKPELEVVVLKDPMMALELPLSNTPVDDEASKEQGEFVEEDAVPTSPNIWGDTEEED